MTKKKRARYPTGARSPKVTGKATSATGKATSATGKATRATATVVNKSAAIRAALAKDPAGKPQAIARALTDQGVEVSAAFVSQVKLKMKQRSAAKPRQESSAGGGQFASAELIEAKRLIDNLGVEKARAAVELLAKLS